MVLRRPIVKCKIVEVHYILVGDCGLSHVNTDTVIAFELSPEENRHDKSENRKLS